VLAYANLVSTAEIVCCLVYLCSQATWESLAKWPTVPSSRATESWTPRSSLANGYSHGSIGEWSLDFIVTPAYSPAIDLRLRLCHLR
jgi:hypothetical protein